MPRAACRVGFLLRLRRFERCSARARAREREREAKVTDAGLQEPDTVVMLESVLLFELLCAVNAAIGVLTLVSLITDTTLLKVPIAEWQQIFGYVVSGCVPGCGCRHRG